MRCSVEGFNDCARRIAEARGLWSCSVDEQPVNIAFPVWMPDDRIEQQSALSACTVAAFWVDVEPTMMSLIAALHAKMWNRPMACGSASKNMVERLETEMGWRLSCVTECNFYGFDSFDDFVRFLSILAAHKAPFEPYLYNVFDAAKWLENLDKCESPIERRLLVHMYASEQSVSPVTTQRVVECPQGSYRLDIAVEYDDEPTWPKLAIETDGHEWHERSKEQAARDKARDRSLAAEGWTVLRYTGSEVWKEPGRCADEALETFWKLVENRRGGSGS